MYIDYFKLLIVNKIINIFSNSHLLFKYYVYIYNCIILIIYVKYKI